MQYNPGLNPDEKGFWLADTMLNLGNFIKGGKTPSLIFGEYSEIELYKTNVETIDIVKLKVPGIMALNGIDRPDSWSIHCMSHRPCCLPSKINQDESDLIYSFAKQINHITDDYFTAGVISASAIKVYPKIPHNFLSVSSDLIHMKIGAFLFDLFEQVNGKQLREITSSVSLSLFFCRIGFIPKIIHPKNGPNAFSRVSNENFDIEIPLSFQEVLIQTLRELKRQNIERISLLIEFERDKKKSEKNKSLEEKTNFSNISEVVNTIQELTRINKQSMIKPLNVLKEELDLYIKLKTMTVESVF
ncbi:hypothetical protein QUF70_04560 [Desulfobacterales bacterium HSG17]|nr:hypothetical protein [Desulfobacterales bacterium HSG17]